MNNDNLDIITISDLCDMLGCGYNTAYRLLGEKKIPAFRIGKCWKVPREGVYKYIKLQAGLCTDENPFK